MSDRVAEVCEQLRARSLDALIVDDAANLRYLSGFTGSNGIAVIAAEGEATFLTDFRYKEQSATEVDERFARSIVAQDLLDELPASLPAGRIGFNDVATSVARARRLAEALGPRAELIAAGGLVEDLRVVKDAREVELVAAAAALVDGIYEWILERGLAGRSERQVAIDLEHEMRLRGASGPSFSSIVAGGAHAALPHAQPRDTVIERGTLVIIDIGALVDGYCSDCTRTFAVGEPSAQAREIYELVLSAQQRGLDALAAGLTGFEVDAQARSVIADGGYGEYHGHGLGHGVGLEIHERPRLSHKNADELLRIGNVVTVEPGVYLPGTLGVRIEDLTVVTESGARRLSKFTKELLVVD
ncbi:MAG: Xaa-Pro peptidase family protein [Solirubrobacteraceae bacterium]